MIFGHEEIRMRLKANPFTPVRFVTSAGQSYDVYHPDLVMVGVNSIMVGMPSTQSPTVYDQVTRLAIAHLTEMRDIPAVVQPASNGTPAA